MFSRLFALAAVAATISLTSACVPNFQGHDLSVYNGFGGEWSPDSLTAGSSIRPRAVDSSSGEFRFEQDGQDPTSFIIKASHVPANNLVVDAEGSALKLTGINLADTSPTQRFKVNCGTCNVHGNSVDATDCRITSSSGLCVGANGAGVALDLERCLSRAGGQVWRFTAA